MIITLCFIVLFIIGIILYKKDGCSFCSIGCFVLGIAGAPVCLFFILIANSSFNKECTSIDLKEQYNIYTTQINNSSENIVLLSSEIAKYNADIKKNRKYQNDIWVGWFIPNIYNDMPIIEVNISK